MIIWEPKTGFGGGHRAVLDRDKAERMCQRLAWENSQNNYRIEPAENFAAAAVLEHYRHTPRRSTSRA